LASYKIMSKRESIWTISGVVTQQFRPDPDRKIGFPSGCKSIFST